MKSVAEIASKLPLPCANIFAIPAFQPIWSGEAPARRDLISPGFTVKNKKMINAIPTAGLAIVKTEQARLKCAISKNP